ncbi:MAG: hypothetical protein ACRDKT_06435, partial [Actinomycetota bacterium]
EVEVEVPVQIVGESPGVKEGGVQEQPLHSVHVRCLPGDVPEAIEADISNLNIGDSLRVSDLSEGRDFHILNDPEAPVITIVAPISEEELEAMEAAAGVVAEEPEEVAESEEGEEGEVEGAEGEEGETPAETPSEESAGG